MNHVRANNIRQTTTHFQYTRMKDLSMLPSCSSFPRWLENSSGTQDILTGLYMNKQHKRSMIKLTCTAKDKSAWCSRLQHKSQWNTQDCSSRRPQGTGGAWQGSAAAQSSIRQPQPTQLIGTPQFGPHFISSEQLSQLLPANPHVHSRAGAALRAPAHCGCPQAQRAASAPAAPHLLLAFSHPSSPSLHAPAGDGPSPVLHCSSLHLFTLARPSLAAKDTERCPEARAGHGSCPVWLSGDHRWPEWSDSAQHSHEASSGSAVLGIFFLCFGAYFTPLAFLVF